MKLHRIKLLPDTKLISLTFNQTLLVKHVRLRLKQKMTTSAIFDCPHGEQNSVTLDLASTYY